MKRENRYIVIKRSDIAEMVEHGRMFEKVEGMLENALDMIEIFREEQGKKPPTKYVVVGKDWPMYEDTWKAIEDWVDSRSKVK